jgi:hypothetical protein
VITANSLLGASLTVVIGVVIARLLFWRRQRPVFWFVCALVLVGAGYLLATGAAEDIGGGLLSSLQAA